MKSSNTTDPFLHLSLDEEEQRLETALEKGEFEEVANLNKIKKQVEAAAKHHRQLNTARPITLRINQLDLIKIKAKAKHNNMPYQTHLGAVLHDFEKKKKEIKLK